MSDRSAAKERAQNFGDPNYDARQRLVNDPEKLQQRLSGLDRDKYDVSGYSDKEIGMSMRGDSFGAEDYERLTGKTLSDDKPKSNTDTAQPVADSTKEADSNTYQQPKMETSTQQATTGFGKGSSNDYYSNKAEFDYNYSQKAFNVDNYLKKNIKQATDATKADDMYRGLKQGAHDTIGYYRNRSNLTTLGIFGDIWNTNQRPTFKGPGNPKPITTTYNSKDKDDDE